MTAIRSHVLNVHSGKLVLHVDSGKLVADIRSPVLAGVLC